MYIRQVYYYKLVIEYVILLDCFPCSIGLLALRELVECFSRNFI